MTEVMFAAFVAVAGWAGSTQSWPAIRPFERSYDLDFGDGERDAPISIVVRGLDGVGLYRLDCHTSDYVRDDLVISFSGCINARSRLSTRGSRQRRGTCLPRTIRTNAAQTGGIVAASIRTSCRHRAISTKRTAPIEPST